MEKKLILVGILMIIGTIGLAYAQIEVGDIQGGVVLQDPTSVTEANLSFNETFANQRYWRLDGTNAPPSANWDMGSTSFTDVDTLSFDSLGSPSISSSALKLIMSADIMEFAGDTINYGSGLGNVNLGYLGTTTGAQVWLGASRIFDFQAGMNIDDNLTVLGGVNISKDLDVQRQTLMENVSINGFLDSDDGEINIGANQNITFLDNAYGRIIWDDAATSNQMYIGDRINGATPIMTLKAAQVEFLTSNLALGQSNANECIKFQAQDGTWKLCAGATNAAWDNHWTTELIPFRPASFAFSQFTHIEAFNNRWTWDTLGANHVLNITGDFDFVANQVNTNNDFCIDGGNCLSAMSADVRIMNTSWVTKAKEADTVTASSTFVEDSELNFTVEAGINYTFEFNIFASAATSVDMAFNFTRPSGEIVYRATYNDQAAGYSNLYCESCSDSGVIQTGTNIPMIEVAGTLFPTANGDFNLQYRKVAGIPSLTIQKGSNAILREIEE